ncbi:ABC transporter permease [Acetobacteraceae bacterium KSS8]|uniref:ABC transporter permease n=1 Tax=Endosaccharibacter trunci TaxID=2812733 RepID=A0ABT1W778_9PROT|nr:ABC transporter permease [Acetobacteraceae bacterium KSS8]
MARASVTRLTGRPLLSRRQDGLALRRAMPDRLLPALVAAMTFLAALALAGAVGASLLAQRWNNGAAAIMTIQVPDADAPAATGAGKRGDAVLAVLSHDPAFAAAIPVDRARLAALLAPWLGGAGGSGTGAPALSLPGVIQARLRPGVDPPADLAARLESAAPGTLAERNQPWTARLVALTRSLQACAALALLVVTGVAVAVVAAATRAGLAARRHSIEIVHGLGAGDGYIAGRFARRTTVLALSGGIIGTILSVPLLLLLCRLGAPFASGAALPPTLPDGDLAAYLSDALARVPLPLWIALPLLPPVSASIGWLTAQFTVRAWLRRLP